MFAETQTKLKTALSRDSDYHFRLFVVLLLLAAGAYGTDVTGYRPALDDTVLEQSLSDSDSAFHYRQQGLWRLASIPLMGIGIAGDPALYNTAVLLLHVFNGLVLARILRRLGASSAWIAACAATFVVFPGYHEAMVWIGASGVVWSGAFFLVALAVSLEEPVTVASRQRLAIALVVIVTTGNLLHEQMLLAYLAMPAAVLLWRTPGSYSTAEFLKTTWWRFAPWIGCGLYLVGYLSTLQTTTTKQPVFSLRAAVSPLWHQWSNFMAFEVWAEPFWVKSFIRTLANPGGIAAALMLVAGATALAALMRRAPASDGDHAAQNAFRTAIAWMMLIAATAAIYAFAGGYSLDSRKRYVFVALILMALAQLLSVRGIRPGRTFGVGLAAFSIAAGCTAAALTEARKAMIDAIGQFETQHVAEAWSPPIHIEGWEDSPTSLYRHLWTDLRDRLYQLPGRDASSCLVTKHRTAARTRVSYDWVDRRWTVRP